MKRAIVLLSGGVDSSTLLFWAREKYDCTAITFDYGQRHKIELHAAAAVARAARCSLKIIPLRLPLLKSSLTDRRIVVPAGALKRRHIPATYVPARNTVFLSIALALAESGEIPVILIGVNSLDFSGYPDCRSDYMQAMNRVSRLGTKTGREGRPVRILAPFIGYSKAAIIRLGSRLGVPYHLTWSCYRGGRKPCGTCDSCLIREKGFREAYGYR